MSVQSCMEAQCSRISHLIHKNLNNVWHANVDILNKSTAVQIPFDIDPRH